MRSRALSLSLSLSLSLLLYYARSVLAMTTTVFTHGSLGKAKQCPQISMLYWIKAAMWSMIIITTTLHDLGEGKNAF